MANPTKTEKTMAHSKVVALCGGVGGAKLALGLSKRVDGNSLTIAVNTGDDFQHLGLPISPDIDTVMYTLAGINNSTQGWGLEGETWQAMTMFQHYGAETWFQLGDRDLATHIARKQLLDRGLSLSQATAHLCQSLGISANVLPMSDDRVATKVKTNMGELAFQEYFVKHQCRPQIKSLHYQGAAQAKPQQTLIDTLAAPDLDAIIICPSNPFLSVEPMLQMPDLVCALKRSKAPVIAISPIVSGDAIKGPTAKIMREMNMEVSATAIAHHYRHLLDGFVIDDRDQDLATAIEHLGIAVQGAPTIMKTLDDRITLAETAINFASKLRLTPW